ncbi:MAG: hypothetical protein ACJAY2_003752 [Pseudomonadales bacterium]|jgi:hypothetical protein
MPEIWIHRIEQLLIYRLSANQDANRGPMVTIAQNYTAIDSNAKIWQIIGRRSKFCIHPQAVMIKVIAAPHSR